MTTPAAYPLDSGQVSAALNLPYPMTSGQCLGRAAGIPAAYPLTSTDLLNKGLGPAYTWTGAKTIVGEQVNSNPVVKAVVFIIFANGEVHQNPSATLNGYWLQGAVAGAHEVMWTKTSGNAPVGGGSWAANTWIATSVNQSISFSSQTLTDQAGVTFSFRPAGTTNAPFTVPVVMKLQ